MSPSLACPIWTLMMYLQRFICFHLLHLLFDHMCSAGEKGRTFFSASGAKDGEEISARYEVGAWVLDTRVRRGLCGRRTKLSDSIILWEQLSRPASPERERWRAGSRDWTSIWQVVFGQQSANYWQRKLDPLQNCKTKGRHLFQISSFLF